VYFQRVAIDDARLTRQVIGCGGGRWRKDQRREHGYRCSGHPGSVKWLGSMNCMGSG
jgi:hypothetical protein